MAALGDVARGFGQADNGGTLVAQAGLSGTDLGIGLAIMRLASLGALPVIGLADRFGRRTLLLATVGVRAGPDGGGRGKPHLLVVRGHQARSG